MGCDNMVRMRESDSICSESHVTNWELGRIAHTCENGYKESDKVCHDLTEFIYRAYQNYNLI